MANDDEKASADDILQILNTYAPSEGSPPPKSAKSPAKKNKKLIIGGSIAGVVVVGVVVAFLLAGLVSSGQSDSSTASASEESSSQEDSSVETVNWKTVDSGDCLSGAKGASDYELVDCSSEEIDWVVDWVMESTDAEVKCEGIKLQKANNTMVCLNAYEPSIEMETKLDYASEGISGMEPVSGTSWQFDVCSPDAAFLEKELADQIVLERRISKGNWQELPQEFNVEQPGRCPDDGINVLAARTESVEELESELGIAFDSNWSECIRYRVIFPETANYAESKVPFCINLRQVG